MTEDTVGSVRVTSRGLFLAGLLADLAGRHTPLPRMIAQAGVAIAQARQDEGDMP